MAESINNVDVNEGQNICSICYESMDDKSVGKLNTCEHNYCYECIIEWFNSNKRTCPLDRKVFRYIELYENGVLRPNPFDETNVEQTVADSIASTYARGNLNDYYDMIESIGVRDHESFRGNYNMTFPTFFPTPGQVSPRYSPTSPQYDPHYYFPGEVSPFYGADPRSVNSDINMLDDVDETSSVSFDGSVPWTINPMLLPLLPENSVSSVSPTNIQASDHGSMPLGQVCLSRLKETVAPSECDRTPEAIRIYNDYYPFATVLRLRVLQIVCGISFLIVGTVAFIEERGELNLSLGIPAGGTTILAAAASIHTTKGFGGYRASTCLPDSPFRFLGPTIRIAVPVAILWGSTCSFVAAVVIQCVRTIAGVQEYDSYDEFITEDLTDIAILAGVELILSLITLLSIILLLRIDCKFDPD